MSDEIGRNLSLCAYEGVLFPGADIETAIGHDSARHQGYGIRGADIETTGPKAVTVSMRAVMKNGLRGWTGPALFPDQYARLVRTLESTPEGYLTHPTRGLMLVHFDDAKELINVRERRGLELTLSFTEQRGESELIDFAPTSTAPDVAMQSAAAEADALAPAGSPSLAPSVDDTLSYLDAAPRSYLDVTARLDALVRSTQAAMVTPGASSSDAHEYRVALHSLLGATLAFRARHTTSGQRVIVVPAEMSLARVAALPGVFGDPRRAAELLRSNAITDPSRIPAGTRLTVVD